MKDEIIRLQKEMIDMQQDLIRSHIKHTEAHEEVIKNLKMQNDCYKRLCEIKIEQTKRRGTQ